MRQTAAIQGSTAVETAGMVWALEQLGTGIPRYRREAPLRSRRKGGLPMPFRASPLVARRARRSALLLFMESREELQGVPACLSEPTLLRPRTILVGLSIQSSLVNSCRGSKRDSLCLSSSSSSNLVRAQFRSYRLRINSNALRHPNAWDRVLSTCQQPLVCSLLSTEAKTPTRLINLRLRTAG